MAVAVKSVMEHIHRIAGAVGRKHCTDRQLLEDFAHRREEAAFAALVRRHGPMVFGVCRRVLGHHQDAEDVFQATFLVLARKASSVHWQDSVGNWLYGVAYRLAQKLRASKARQQKKLVAAEAQSAYVQNQPGQWRELQTILDEELQRLPDKFRAPLVLCYLEGKTRDEAAHQLGWTMPMVKGRLERGRNLLRDRLTRRGLALSTALLPMALAETGITPAVAAPLVTETVKAATAVTSSNILAGFLSPQAWTLTQGALNVMFWTKIKLTALTIMCLALLGTGAGLVAHRALAVDNISEGSAQEISQFPQGDFLAAGQEKEGQEGKSLKGTLKSIDVKKGVVVVTTQRDGEGKKDHTLSLAGKDIKVTSKAERPIKVEDLKPGFRVTAYLSPADDVTSIRLDSVNQEGEGGKKRPSQVYGVIKAVDPAKSTITLIQKREGGDEIETTFEVFKGTPDRPWEGKKLAEWKAGEKVSLLLGENKLVTAIQTNQFGFGKDRPKEGGKEGEEGRALNGELVSLDKAKQTITILQRTDGGPKQKTLDLDKEVKVQLGREEKGSLDDLKQGAKLTLILKEEKVIIIRPLKAAKEKPGLSAVLKKINAKEGTITVAIKGEGGAEREKEFTLSKEAKVIIPDKENASVGDLKEGTRLLLQLGENRQTVIGIRVIKGEGEKDKE